MNVSFLLFLFFSVGFRVSAQENSIRSMDGAALPGTVITQLTDLLYESYPTAYFFYDKSSGSILDGATTTKVFANLEGLPRVVSTESNLQHTQIIIIKCTPQDLMGKQFDFNQFTELSSLKFILFGFDQECPTNNCYQQVIADYMVSTDLDLMVMYQIELPN